MKFKILLIALVCCLTAGAQTPVKPEPLHQILIFKWAKNIDSISYDVIVSVNEKGEVSVTERNDEDGEEVTHQPEERFNMKSLEKSAFAFISNLKINKSGASEEVGEATEPEPGRQVLHISIITINDYKLVANDENMNPAEYFTTIEADYTDNAPAALFSVLSKKDAALLQKLLYPEE